jgi:hypothetical protein
LQATLTPNTKKSLRMELYVFVLGYITKEIYT